jgi:NAD(P)H-flavin reductase
MLDARLIDARMLSTNVRELTFDAGPNFRFEPGQWVNLYFPGHQNQRGDVLKPAYSIASAPSNDGRFALAVARAKGGTAGALLHAASIGARIQAGGPFGAFLMAPIERPILMVATGTGIAPFRSMLEASARQVRQPMALLFGNRDESEVLYRGEFESLARENSLFSFQPTLSQPDPKWTGRHGYVQLHLRELVNSLGGPGCDVYICGQAEMVNDVRRILQDELGLVAKRLHVERYG